MGGGVGWPLTEAGVGKVWERKTRYVSVSPTPLTNHDCNPHADTPAQAWRRLPACSHTSASSGWGRHTGVCTWCFLGGGVQMPAQTKLIPMHRARRRRRVG